MIITVETNSSTDGTLIVGKSINITINAKYTGTVAACPGSVVTQWTMYANQSVSGGTGNAFSLNKTATYPTVTVAQTACQTDTNLTLALVTNHGNQTIITTETSATVTLTAKLTSALAPGGISGENVTFKLGAAITGCTNLPTDTAGTATCTFSPQLGPTYPLGGPLGSGTWDFHASFGGDPGVFPVLGGSTSDPAQLTVNADGTGLQVTNILDGVFGQPVNLSATLTSSSNVGIPGRTITFSFNGQTLTAVTGDGTTGTLGVATLTGVSTSIPTIMAAGPHDGAIKASFAGDGTGGTYGPIDASGNLYLLQQSSNITLGNLTQTYNGTPLSPSVTTVPPSLSTSMTGAPQTNAGSYQVTATITDPNYSGSAGPVTFTIQQRPVTALITVSNKVYDGNTSVSITGCALVGAVSGDDVGCAATSAFATAGVANSITVTATSLNLTGSAQGNYMLSGTPQTLANITPAPATVTAVAKTKTYGDDNPALTATVGGTFGTDVLNYTLGTTAVKTSPVGGYPITVTLGSNPNYSVTPTNSTLTVNQRTATVAAVAKSKTYGTANPTLTATVTGAAIGDTLNYTLDTTATSTSGVGPYPITVTLGSNPNYSVTSSDSTLTVNQAVASVTPNAATKVYNTTDPAVTGTLVGFLPADNVTAAYSRTPGETVAGSYTISAVLAPTTGILANYNITYNTAPFTITRATQNVTLAPFSGIVSSDGTDASVAFNINSGNCTVTAGGLVTITGSTICSVTATRDNYFPVTRTITISEN